MWWPLGDGSDSSLFDARIAAVGLEVCIRSISLSVFIGETLSGSMREASPKLLHHMVAHSPLHCFFLIFRFDGIALAYRACIGMSSWSQWSLLPLHSSSNCWVPPLLASPNCSLLIRPAGCSSTVALLRYGHASFACNRCFRGVMPHILYAVTTGIQCVLNERQIPASLHQSSNILVGVGKKTRGIQFSTAVSHGCS